MNPYRFLNFLRWHINMLVMLGGFLLTHACDRAQETGRLDLDKLDEYLEQSRQQWNVPGLAIAVVKDDSVVFAKGYGKRQSDGEGEIDEHTIFSIASITKGFTSSALAMLVDEGKIGWDDPVIRYLPGFRLYDPWVSNEIRIRDLLCHRSGYKTFSGDLLWFETGYSGKEVLQRVQYLRPEYGFRYRYGYSNLMYLAAGEIIPAVTDTGWDGFVADRLLRPLEMNRTFFGPEDLVNEPNVAMPHHVDLLDGTTRVIPYMKWDNLAPAGALHSSAMDMSRWIRFQLNLGKWNGMALISEENLWETREMHTVQPLEIGNRNIWPSRHFKGYGLGWELYDYHGWKVVKHEGAWDGMLSLLVMVPEENFGFIILSNSLSMITTGLEYYILDQYSEGKSYDWSAIYLKNFLSYQENERKEWEEYLASADRSIEPSRDLADYVGLYGCDLYGNVELRYGDEGLVLDFLPSERMIGDLEHFSRDTFLIRFRDMPFMPDGTVKFFLDENGKVSEMKVDIPKPDLDFTELELMKLNDQKK